jgi:2Fe-2S ferredoxin
MIQIIFAKANGDRIQVDGTAGDTLMQAAVDNSVDGIVAECGGSAMCATCHVYVDPDVLRKLPPLRPEEEAMLDSTASERRVNSRLSCQIRLTPELDGAVFELPDRQV